MSEFYPSKSLMALSDENLREALEKIDPRAMGVDEPAENAPSVEIPRIDPALSDPDAEKVIAYLPDEITPIYHSDGVFRRVGRGRARIVWPKREDIIPEHEHFTRGIITQLDFENPKIIEMTASNEESAPTINTTPEIIERRVNQ